MITDSIQETLERENVSLTEFKELVIRLLNYGVLCRSESQTEQYLYDRYLRVKELLRDYFAIMDVHIFHEPKFEYLRVYPPASQVPGMEDTELTPFGGSLRSRLRQEEVALILVLHIQYDKALHEGQVDEHGFVTESMESLSIAMKNILGRSFPDKLTDRRRLFQRIRQLRLIDFRQEADIESGEGWLKIHPMIVSFINEEAMQSLDTDISEQSDKEEMQQQSAQASDGELSRVP